MNETKIFFLNKRNEKLTGIETFPDTKKEKYPTIVLVHGFGVSKNAAWFEEISIKLSRQGFLVCRFDFSGCGESEGNYNDTSLTKLKLDLENILEFVKSLPKVDKSKIALFGQSLGTSVIVTLEPKVKTIILTGSIANPNKILKKSLKTKGIYNPKGISIRKWGSGRVTKIKPEFWKNLKEHNLLESIKKIHCPILFIHGSKDSKVPISEMEDYFKVANNPREKVIIKGANHEMRPCREEMYKIVINWFKKYL